MPWLGLVAVGISVDAYAMVGIVADSGNRRSDNQRSGKRRCAPQRLQDFYPPSQGISSCVGTTVHIEYYF